MSIEERNDISRDGMGQLPGDVTRQTGAVPGPLYKPGQSIPPDLQYKDQRQRPPPPPGQSQNLGDINQLNNEQLFRALRRQGYFMTEPFNATTEVQLLRPFESRTYLFIQNIDTVNDIILGFGNAPTGNDGLVLPPGAAYEPFTIPINEIYIISSAGAVKGYIIYSRENEG